MLEPIHPDDVSTARELFQRAQRERQLDGTEVRAEVAAVLRDRSDDEVTDLPAELGQVDLLIANAGTADVKGWQEIDLVSWNATLAVNLTAPFLLAQQVLPGMIEREFGRVITIVSDAARWGEPTLAPYSAAKAGAAGLTRAVAREVGRYGITANNIALASIDPTGGHTDAAQSPTEVREQFDKQLRSYIIRRFGRPDEVAALVTFLASDFGAWITGQTIPLNGGYTVNQ